MAVGFTETNMFIFGKVYEKPADTPRVSFDKDTIWE